MTHASYWTASDGTQLHYRYDDFTERLSDLDIPIVLGVPDPDPMVERTEYARISAYVCRLTYVEFPGAGHSMTAEIPDACARAYAEFLATVESR